MQSFFVAAAPVRDEETRCNAARRKMGSSRVRRACSARVDVMGRHPPRCRSSSARDGCRASCAAWPLVEVRQPRRADTERKRSGRSARCIDASAAGATNDHKAIFRPRRLAASAVEIRPGPTSRKMCRTRFVLVRRPGGSEGEVARPPPRPPEARPTAGDTLVVDVATLRATAKAADHATTKTRTAEGVISGPPPAWPAPDASPPTGG